MSLPCFWPSGHYTPKSSEARRPAEGLRLALLSQPGLACLQLEGLSPSGGLSSGGSTQNLGAESAAGAEEIGTGSFLSETETARCFPPAGVTQRQLDQKSCSPTLQPSPAGAATPLSCKHL